MPDHFQFAFQDRAYASGQVFLADFFLQRIIASVESALANPVMYMTASLSVLLGIVPVWRETPPIIPLRSMTATFLPSFVAAMAPFCPAGPLPITTRS